ncbi:ABC transporter ATP-binding protein [Hyphobacterium marinum]|uniref:Dipeptide ABC transporter ATP-binding protein n=1 Tax=Hyphobacterium marinum TaxID=3116574 RepID=A0ABU7M1I0_9PROT|nr:dipeptide ABC transporter ATP-binding protein [Hyphobacterium sp. Y6023]MEE2567678.1 dipeptide ABC transporter ATP-binding protein [Hyphobacterium sp. Y6023]
MTSPSANTPILAVEDLHVRFATPDGEVNAVRGVSLEINAGECLAVVGESGSGKSQTFLAAMGLLASNGRAEGAIRYRGESILNVPLRKLNKVRGKSMTMIFQDPLTSLTPHMRVGDQMNEVLAKHMNLSGGAARKRALEWLERVRIPEAKRRLKQYPHELSGGMRQRVMIAMSMLCEPDLLIADEPTTALDVTVQAQVLDIMDELKRETGAAIALITHDMGVVARMADRVEVMKNGVYVEGGTADQIFGAPKDPYTRMLLDAMPRIDQPDKPGHAVLPPYEDIDGEGPVLSAEDIKVYFPVTVSGGLFPKTKPLKAVDGVSFDLRSGETLGVVGESGCGKSTLARAVLQLVPTQGEVTWMGRDLVDMERKALRDVRKDLQIVFQDPLASLNPRMTIGASIAEPLKTHRPGMKHADRQNAVRQMMRKVGLDPNMINRYPHELSGGQNQRVGIARAMILGPKLVICDEAVSALDVSIQAQIIDLLISLQKEMGLSMIFISHDLSVVREVSHRVMVLYLGRIVEFADRGQIYDDARHPYTKALISAVPIPDPAVERARARVKLDGDLPSPMDPRAQLRFMKSKLIDDPDAEQYRPQLIEVSPGHWVAEHDPAEDVLVTD